MSDPETTPPERADTAVPEPDLPLWELVQTYHVVARGFQAVFAAAGLTATQFGVLAALAGDDASDPGPTQADLARRVLVRPQSMGELVTSLLDRGLVERDRPAGRGRRHGLRLTEAGQRLLEHSVPAVHAFNAPAAIGLTDDEADTLVHLLRRVRHTLSEGDTP